MEKIETHLSLYSKVAKKNFSIVGGITKLFRRRYVLIEYKWLDFSLEG